MAPNNKFKVDQLVNEAKEDKTNKKINNLATLIDLVSSSSSDLSRFYALDGSLQLIKYFVLEKKFGMYKKNSSQEANSSETKVPSWLFEMHCDCVKEAGKLLVEVEKETLKQKLVKLYIELLKISGECLFNDDEFQGGLRQEDIAVLVEFASKNTKEKTEVEVVNYILQSLSYLDFAYAFLYSVLTKIKNMKNPEPKPETLRHLFELLKSISENMDVDEQKYLLDPVKPSDLVIKKRNKKLGAKRIKQKFSSCWLEFLNFKLPGSIVKDVLILLKDDIIPNIQQPRLLTDFLLNVSKKGSGKAVLALEGLFHLMVYENVQVDDFFKHLYNMLHPRLFQELYMKRYFNLLNLTLESTHVPESVVASFVKKLARLSLTAPPNGTLLCVKMAINVTKRHSLQYLIHREHNETVLESDPFDYYSEDPTNTGATASSLWELEGLNAHFLPAVRKIAEPVKLKRKLGSKFERKIDKLLEEDDHHLMEKYCNMEFDKDHCAGVGDAASTVDELFC